MSQLERDLTTNSTVRNALGEQATGEFLEITRRLEPASIKHGVVSIGRRARQTGRVALAFLTDDEARAFQIDPSLMVSLLPEQKEHYNKLPIYPADKMRDAVIVRVAAELMRHAPLEPLTCGGEMFLTLADARAITVAASSVSLRNFRETYSVAYRPTIIMRLPSSNPQCLPRHDASTLLHEERHVLQACQAPPILPDSLEAQEECHSQTRFRAEVEAHHQTTVYEKAVGIASDSWLEDIREDLDIPLIGPDEPFDAYIPLVKALGKEGLAWLHGEAPSHHIDNCCIQSLITSRLHSALFVRSSHLRA